MDWMKLALGITTTLCVILFVTTTWFFFTIGYWANEYDYILTEYNEIVEEYNVLYDFHEEQMDICEDYIYSYNDVYLKGENTLKLGV